LRVALISIFIIVLVYAVGFPAASPKIMESEAVSPYSYEALVWIGENTPTDSVILTSGFAGFVAQPLSDRKIILSHKGLGGYSSIFMDVQEIARQRDYIYNTQDIAEALVVIKKLGITYIYIGNWEKTIYSHPGLLKFDIFQNFEKVFDNGYSRLYLVKTYELNGAKPIPDEFIDGFLLKKNDGLVFSLPSHSAFLFFFNSTQNCDITISITLGELNTDAYRHLSINGYFIKTYEFNPGSENRDVVKVPVSLIREGLNQIALYDPYYATIPLDTFRVLDCLGNEIDGDFLLR
jgi:hypothetical protein